MCRAPAFAADGGTVAAVEAESSDPRRDAAEGGGYDWALSTTTARTPGKPSFCTAQSIVCVTARGPLRSLL
jgi:hypothetical protein